MKKGLSLFLSFIMALSILTPMTLIVNAENNEYIYDSKGRLVIKCDVVYMVPDGTSFYFISDEPSYYVIESLSDVESGDSDPWLNLGSHGVFDDKTTKNFYCYMYLGLDSEITGTVNDYDHKDIKFKISLYDEIIEEEVIYNSLTLELNDDHASYSVTRCDEDKQGEVIIPNTYNDLPITEIDYWAFDDCKKITSVFIPSSVKKMGKYVFARCENLTKITVDENNQYYKSVDGVLFDYIQSEIIQYPMGCKNDSYTIPNGVKSISDGSFEGCTYLKSVTIPTGVEYIGNNAFGGCSSLTSVSLPDSVETIENMAFYECLSLKTITVDTNNNSYSSLDGVLFNKNQTVLIKYPNACESTTYNIPDSVTQIYGNAFNNCVYLETVIIPDTVVDIYSGAFSDCSNLKSINIPRNLTYIAYGAFSGCDSLSSIIIPDKVTEIGDFAFCDCKNLTSITIPNSVKLIGDRAFYMSYNLSDVYYTGRPQEWNEIEIDTDYGNLSGVRVHYLVRDISSHWTKDDTKLICTGTMAYSCPCGYNYSSNIQEGAGHIWDGEICNICGSSAISYELNDDGNSYTLTNCDYYVEGEIVIPDTYNGLPITKIGMGAFYGCSNLTKVSIGNNVTHIADWAFRECYNLTTIEVGKSVTNIGWLAFMSCYNLTIKGYEGSEVEKYAKENNIAFVALNHTHKSSNWVTDKKATVNAEGSKHKECTECGEVLETATIKQLKCSKPKLSKISNTSSGVKITWGKISGADSYEVYRKVKGGSYSKVGTTSKTYFTDKKAKSGKKYYYIVKAVNEAGKSDSSSSLSKYHLADPTLKTPKSTKSGVSLKWTKTTGAQGYIIYRKTGSGSYKKLKTEKGVSNLSYVDKSAKKGKKYTYKVKAYYSKTYSAYSNTKTIKDKY